MPTEGSNETAQSVTAARKPATSPKKRIQRNARTKPGRVAAVWIAVAKLKPWLGNPRKRDRAKDKKLARTIKAEVKEAGPDGFGAPVLARKANGELIAGHRRVRAAIIAGMTHVPVRYLNVSAKQAHRMALADNRHAKDIEDDDDLLADAIEDMDAEDLELAGYEDKEIEDLLGEGDGDGLDEDDEDEGGSKLRSGLTYQVVVECKDEQEQAEVLEQLENDGRKCKPIIV